MRLHFRGPVALLLVLLLCRLPAADGGLLDGASQLLGFGSSGGAAAGRPLPLGGGSAADVVQVSAGGWHSAIVLADGRLLTAGDNQYGQLGRSANGSSESAAAVVHGVCPGSTVVEAACGKLHTVVLCQVLCAHADSSA